MGEKLLDELARALAEPLPRRRALRLIGSALVAVSFPGAARAAGARGRRAADPICGVGVKLVKCGSNWCCPEDVCKSVGGIYGCYECPKHRKCGKLGCCPARSECCINTDREPNDPYRRVCCKLPNTCQAGVCRCPNGKESCTGAGCCKETQKCSLCNAKTGTTKCCPKGDWKCCWPVPTCCKFSDDCCYGKCCPTGTTCAVFRGKNMCCPDDRVWAYGESNLSRCCPGGTVVVAVGTDVGCCPPGQPDCCGGVECGGIQICVSGVCVNP